MKKIITLFLLFAFASLRAQAPMEVLRTKAVDRATPVTNVFIDAENNKWVGNEKGTFQVFSPEQATRLDIPPADWSLLQTPCGNRDLRFPLEDLISQMGDSPKESSRTGEGIRTEDDRITAAIFEEKGSQLWVGTMASGLFQFRTQPTLKLVQRHHSGNSKLGSDEVNTLFLDAAGRLWIGTSEGCAYGKDGKWSQKEKDFSIEAFANNGADVWVMGDDLLWKVRGGEDWEPIDIDASLTDHDVVDIAFDGNGMLWVASEIVSRYDPLTEEAKVFGPADEFTSQDVSCMAIDRENAVWIGTNDKGLYLIQKADAMAVTCLIDKPLSCGTNKKDASLKVTVSGGEAPYTYAWAGGLSGTNPQNLGAGEYSLTVTDSRGKAKPVKFSIGDPNLKLEIKQDKPAGESGAADGVASVSVTGGNPAFSFKWDNGETTAKTFTLAEGTHSVTVTDKSGCTATASVNISQSVGELSLSISQTKTIACAGGKDAALAAKLSGGKAPFKFQWGGDSGAVAVGNETVSNLAAGNYTLLVTDATGQTASAVFSVKDATRISATLKVDAPASTGNSDGKATAKASGGTGNFSFRWDNGEASATATKLAPGTRTVTATDGAGCTSTASVSISENILPLAASISQTKEIRCAGEKTAEVKAEVSGGKTPFKFQWNVSNASGETAAGLPFGSYSVTVTDATGQTTTSTLAVNEPKPVAATVKVDAPASTGNSDGKATAKATGGTGNFSFRWDNGEAAATAVKLAPGSHSVTATDGAGCTSTASVSISENILPLAASIAQTKEIRCAGEKTAEVKAEVSGGKTPFKFQWNVSNASGETAMGLPFGSYSVTVTDATGQTTTSTLAVNEPKPVAATVKVDAPASTGNSDGKATAKASGGTGNFSFKWDNGEAAATAVKLAPGSHSVTVTDGAGCTATASVSITENILPLAASISQTKEIECAGEKTAEVKAEVSGGKTPFKFQWNVSNASGETATGLPFGSYSVTVTDATGQTTTSTLAVNEPKPVAATVKVDAPASTGNSDGKATAKATGGTGNFSFKWDNGEAAATAVKLAPGAHSVTATDGAGCTSTASVSITENILPLAASILQTKEIKCAGEKTAEVKAEMSGGKAPFKFQWNVSNASGETATGLPFGSYSVTVTDATGQTTTSTLAVKEPKPLTASATVNSPAGTNKSDGKATAKAAGGTGEFSYRWDNGETSASAVQLAPGAHAVTVTDKAGCTATASTDISENILPLTISVLQENDIKCAGEKSGALKMTMSGGKPPFSVVWSEGGTDANASNLASGSYSVTVTDATGTKATASKQVSEPRPMVASVIKNRPSTTDKTTNGKASIEASGGAGNFTYAWDNGETSAAAVKLPSGQHKVTVTDGNGCQSELSFETKTRIIPELSAENLRSGETIKLERIYFQPDSTNMDPTSLPTLDELFDFLAENEAIIIEVGGHTNNIPLPEFCDKLSTERAKSVAQYLVNKGLPVVRITFKGYGKRNPVATNATPEGRAKNQRVEVKIVRVN